jgi:hypothetical protein
MFISVRWFWVNRTNRPARRNQYNCGFSTDSLSFIPLPCPCSELGAVDYARLGQQVAHVSLDGTYREVEPSRDLLVRQTLSDEPDDLEFTRADPKGLGGPRPRDAERQCDGILDGQA